MLRIAVRLGVIALALAVAWATPAVAHPPYEHLAREVTDGSGRPLRLMKSYVDGIFFTDPVKLVVRDENDRAVVETEYGRDLSVLCVRPPACVVFRYDGLTPVVPTNVWRFEGSQLHETGSPLLRAAGVIAPLWDHAGGYLFSLVSLGAPFLILRLIWRMPVSALRTTAGTAWLLAAFPYMGLWLYTVLLLSYLSLPLVAALGVIVAGGFRLVRRIAPQVGISEARLSRVGRAAAMTAVGVTGLLIVGVTGTLVWLASYSASIEFEEPSVQAPLAKASVTKARGKTSEVFATLAAGTKLEDVASLRLFDGFEAAMTKEEAERRLGPPSGRWTDPIYGVRATYYDRPDGRVSLVRRGEEWQTVGHPSKCRTDEVFRDPRMLQQFQQWLPRDEHVQVNVLRSAGWGGLSVWTNDKACTHLVLTARDSDPTELPD